MHGGSHFGAHFGAHLGSVAAESPIAEQFPDHAGLVRIAALVGGIQAAVLAGRLAAVGSLAGLLQQIGPVMIDLIGSLSVPQGDSLSYRLTVYDDNGAPIDLTGYAIEVQVKLAVGDADPPVISKSVGSGVAILTQSGATKGQADVTISSSDTNIAVRQYMLDVVVTKSGVRTHVIRPRAFAVTGVVNQL